MKKWLTKKNVLTISFLGIISSFILANPVFFGICTNSYTFSNYVGCLDILSETLSETLLYSMVILFLFSITTYKMPEKVFRHWINFAQWATPLLMIMTFLILGGGNNGMGVEGVIGGAFDAFLIGFFYVLFVGISIWRIVSVRKK